MTPRREANHNSHVLLNSPAERLSQQPSTPNTKVQLFFCATPLRAYPIPGPKKNYRKCSVPSPLCSQRNARAGHA